MPSTSGSWCAPASSSASRAPRSRGPGASTSSSGGDAIVDSLPGVPGRHPLPRHLRPARKAVVREELEHFAFGQAPRRGAAGRVWRTDRAGGRRSWSCRVRRAVRPRGAPHRGRRPRTRGERDRPRRAGPPRLGAPHRGEAGRAARTHARGLGGGAARRPRLARPSWPPAPGRGGAAAAWPSRAFDWPSLTAAPRRPAAS